MTYTCPLCDWTLESEVARMRRPDNLAAAPGVAAALGVPTDAMLSIHENACRRRDEHELEQHLSTHGPKDWLPALTAALDATQHLEIATTSAAERIKVIDQASRIAQMGGVDDDMLTALLTLAAARAMTPTVEARLREQGIEPDPCRVRELIAEARRDPRAREAIAQLGIVPKSLDDVLAVAAAGEALPTHEPVTCESCGRSQEVAP